MSVKQVAVITGGGGGMGLATAKLVGKACYVILCDLSVDRLDAALLELRSLGIEAEAVPCDITDQAAVEALAARARAVGRVVSVIHTAGVSPHMGDAEKILSINALGTLHVNEAFYTIAEEGLCIVNVASMAAHLLPRFLIPARHYGLSLTDRRKFFQRMLSACTRLPRKARPGIAYSISKHFVMWYCRTQAGHFGGKGARLLSVSPGSFDTEMGRLEGEAAAKPVQHAAIKRYGRVEEIAELLAFCASAKASYLTGTDILCDGGTVAGLKLRDVLRMSKVSS